MQDLVEKSYSEVVDSLQEVVFEIDLVGNLQFINKTAFDLFGYSLEDIEGGFNVLSSFIPEDRERIAVNMGRILQGEDLGFSEFTAIRKDGSIFSVAIHTTLVIDEDRATGFRGIIIDISANKKNEEVLKRYKLLFEHARDIILFVNKSDYKILEANKASLDAYGYTREELLAMNIDNLFMAKDFSSNNFQWGEYNGLYEALHQKKNGGSFYVEISMQEAQFENCQVILFIIRDITERKYNEERMTYLSLHDNLTGVYNRTYFEKEMTRLEIEQCVPIGLLICDVDGLKFVNDTLGHEKGDELLFAATRVLTKPLAEKDILTRIGGDEFAILLHCRNKAYMDEICNQIAEEISSYNRESSGFALSISIGMAYCEEISKISNLFKEADKNMYREKLGKKQRGRNAILQNIIKALEARDFFARGQFDQLDALNELIRCSNTLTDPELFEYFIRLVEAK